MKLTLRPLMPPSEFSFLKYAASVFPIVAYADAGPEYGMMLPILISVADAPGSNFFCATALAVSAVISGAATMAARTSLISNRRIVGLPICLPVFSFVISGRAAESMHGRQVSTNRQQ